MVRLQHFLHPIDSSRALCRVASKIVFASLVERRLRRIPRGQREHCWCGGELLSFKWHSSYGVCAQCGCYVNRRPPIDLQSFYSSDLYWNLIQKYYGYPPIESRGEQYKNDGRLSRWLEIVERYGPTSGRVIEVGCAPGVLLADLKARGYECVGVEPDHKTAGWIQRHMGIDVQAGLFPGIQLPRCDLFLAFDVMEHSPAPDQFMLEMAHLLNPGGVAIIQTPIERYGYEPPFGKAFKSAFKDLEHLFLFTNEAIERLTRYSGLEVVSLDERLWLHHEICVFRKPK